MFMYLQLPPIFVEIEINQSGNNRFEWKRKDFILYLQSWYVYSYSCLLGAVDISIYIPTFQPPTFTDYYIGLALSVHILSNTVKSVSHVNDIVVSTKPSRTTIHA